MKIFYTVQFGEFEDVKGFRKEIVKELIRAGCPYHSLAADFIKSISRLSKRQPFTGKMNLEYNTVVLASDMFN